MDFWRFFGDNKEGDRTETSSEDVRQAISEAKLYHYNAHSCFLAGPHKTGKTSLLFRYACTIAEEGKSVVYICQRKNFQNNNVPLFSPAYWPSPSVLRQISIKYIEDDKTLRHYFANIHILPSLPSLFIVDDLSHYFPDEQSKAPFIQTLAFLKEAMSYANRKANFGEGGDDGGEEEEVEQVKCLLLVCYSCGDEDFIQRNPRIVPRWFSQHLTVKGKNPYELSVVRINWKSDPLHMKACYEVTPTSILLHSFEFQPQHEHEQHEQQQDKKTQDQTQPQDSPQQRT